jgi:uncharacterized protein
MNLTLHLTEDCNMACSYCTREKRAVVMSQTVLHAACDLAFSTGTRAGLCFFGGEPLLQQDLIYEALDLCADLSEKTGMPISYKMTTNGTLLTEAFLERARDAGIGIGLSFEGPAQDTCRHFRDGRGSFAVVEEKAKMLLSYMPRSEAMVTIAPQAAGQFAEVVRYLYAMGFRSIIATIAYGKNVTWTDEALAVLEEQMRDIADFYCERILENRSFFFSPFDGKIRDLLTGFRPSERCHLGMRQMPVTPTGKLYACTQFIGDEDYCLGDVFHGVDPEKRAALAKREATPESCKECALRTRCTNSCGCLNRLETGDENRVSPLQCTYERMLIRLADEAGEKLFQKAPQLFIRRFQKI